MEILNKVTSTISFEDKGLIVSYINVYNYAILRKYPEVINEIDYFTFDGVLLKYVFRVLTGKHYRRMAPDFGSYFEELFHFMNKNKESIYIVGAKQGELQTFINIISANYSSIKVIGSKNGYFSSDEEKALLVDIEKKHPNRVLIGMGTPKQELLAIKIKQLATEAAIFPCGAFIGQTSEKGKTYYPKIFNKLNLRWLYRIINEPRLLMRYLIDYPISLCLFTFDFIKKKTPHKTNVS